MKDDPIHIAQENMRAGKTYSICPHGINIWENRPVLAIAGAYGICGCCCHVGPFVVNLCGSCYE